MTHRKPCPVCGKPLIEIRTQRLEFCNDCGEWVHDRERAEPVSVDAADNKAYAKDS